MEDERAVTKLFYIESWGRGFQNSWKYTYIYIVHIEKM